MIFYKKFEKVLKSWKKQPVFVPYTMRGKKLNGGDTFVP